MQLTSEQKTFSWLDQPILAKIAVNWETVIFSVILILAVVSRFYDVGARVMSHDENSHVYYSWRFYRGQGFAHDPLMHGPFQFHVVALSYFLFGDSDFTAHIPAVLFGIATVAFAWAYRRYLGRAGALAAAVMLLISPYMLFYARYVRNEAFVALFGIISLWAMLRYLETGQARYLYWQTIVTVLHYTSKETSFIYSAQALIFLALYLVYRLSQQVWKDAQKRNLFLIALLIAAILGSGGGVGLLQARAARAGATVAPNPAENLYPLPPSSPPTWSLILIGLAGVALMAALVLLLQGFGLDKLRRERSFDLLMLFGTLVLPHLSAFPISALGWKVPTNASEVTALTLSDMWHMALFIVPMALLSILIGVWWNRRQWLINAAIFYGIFTVFYTSVFTNGAGFFTGLVGSLGYWIVQQGVNRGSQPWYYYAFIQIPAYEFLPALGSLLAGLLALLGVRHAVGYRKPEDEEGDPAERKANESSQEAPVLLLLSFWSVSSLVAFSMAGEKMPWLTVHIALPLILLAAWAIGYIIDTTDWKLFRERRGWIILLVLPVFLLSLAATVGSLLGPQPPFQGKELIQLQATSTFFTSFLTAMFSGAGLFFLVRPWPVGQFNRILVLTVFAFLAFLTTHIAIRSSYINYDNANELLVYAHSAGGVKTVLSQIEEISHRTTDGLALTVAYDNETSYPYLWYFRNFSDARFYGANPTRSLRDVPIILVGDANYGKLEPIVGQAYNKFDYVRLWWPNQDYWGLTWDRIRFALTDANMRNAIFKIWLNADYAPYGQATNKDMSLPNWQPSARMRMYIRKDIVAKLWNYGAVPSSEPVQADPYEGKQLQIESDSVLGGMTGEAGSQPGQFQRPRDVEVAADGSLYVADTGNHRIQHLSADGDVLQVWGSYAASGTTAAPENTFNEPWGIGLGPDGSVYVADTWNHRVQKFTADGKFVKMWGYFGQGEKPEAFWGPRDITVDAKGRVFVTDTGNKRVVVFDADGQYISQFGGAGAEAGKFDEPVGIAHDEDGQIYVADTWNQRIQVFAAGEGVDYLPVKEWEVVAWYGQSLDNKPYLTVDQQGNVFVTDPEGYRVLQFSTQGEFIRYWGDYSLGLDGFGLAAAVAVDVNGGVWVSDAANNRLMHFTLPAP